MNKVMYPSCDKKESGSQTADIPSDLEVAPDVTEAWHAQKSNFGKPTLKSSTKDAEKPAKPQPASRPRSKPSSESKSANSIGRVQKADRNAVHVHNRFGAFDSEDDRGDDSMDYSASYSQRQQSRSPVKGRNSSSRGYSPITLGLR